MSPRITLRREPLLDAPPGPLSALDVLTEPGRTLAQRLQEAEVLEQASVAVVAAGSALTGAAYGVLGDLVAAFLDLDVGKALVTGWCSYRELRDAGRQTLGNAEVAVVGLAAEELALVKHPRVEVLLGPARVAEVGFTLRLCFHADALAAVVRDGRLAELSAGRCEVSATLSAFDKTVLEGTRRFDPKVAVALGEGVRLATLPGQHVRSDT